MIQSLNVKKADKELLSDEEEEERKKERKRERKLKLKDFCLLVI